MTSDRHKMPPLASCSLSNFRITSVNQNSKFSNMDKITKSDIVELIVHFAKNTYSAKSETTEDRSILDRCADLMKRDYRIVMVNNDNGELCPHYPCQLPILEYQNEYKWKRNINARESTQTATNTAYENTYDAKKLRDNFSIAKFARCRYRFPVPVILYRGKYICRSSTLTLGSDASSGASEVATSSSQSDWQLFDTVRNQDIKILKTFNVGTIVDLMIENRRFQCGIYVSSSEKVDKEKRYCDFNLISMPYPGMELFKKFRDNFSCPEQIIFDWNPNICDVTINIPYNPKLTTNLNIEWTNYKQWDLVTITANYIKYLLKYFQDDTSGILIHCVCGWDRTPLFISILRMSLWADGLIHQSLNESEILYLTLAYDWMLFGHRLNERLHKRQDVLLFCFVVLKYIDSKEFSIAPPRYRIKKNLQETDVDDSTSTENSVVQGTTELGASTSSTSTISLTEIPAKRIKRVDSSVTTSSVESSSSTSSDGSWHTVCGCGTVLSSDTFYSCCSDTGNSVDDETEEAMRGINRKNKLEAVRELFYGSIFMASGHKTLGPETTLGQILSSIVEKMDFS